MRIPNWATRSIAPPRWSPSGTGVVGVIRGRQDASGRSVGLRADMDALPMQEENDFAHRSSRPGLMHGCGHDGHTTMLLGAAQYLASTRNFDGSVFPSRARRDSLARGR
jgi:metal-dependent amidase/aminoacylase/carboxypeptidase family protein